VKAGRRLFRAVFTTILATLVLGLLGCHTSTATGTGNFPVPTSVSLSPSPTVSLELGTTQAFIPAVQANHTNSTQPVDFQSSNTAVVTVAANGLACAGTWNSLITPQVCTPGPVGVAQVVATAQGVTSQPTTVYVHQHIDQVTVTDMCAVPAPPAPCTVPRNNLCQSLNVNSLPQNTVYEARAFSQGTDITSTVGQFSWQQVNLGVADFNSGVFGLHNMVNGESLNQVQATAQVPGITPVYAAIGTANSVPVNFTTCAVESIALQITEATSTSETITPTVTDTAGNIVMSPGSQVAVPLTWSSSAPASVAVSTSGVATASLPGSASTIIASCTPPTCNVGFLPTQPIYPTNAEEMIVQSTGGTQPANATVYVGSTACGTTDNCVSTIIPVVVPTNVLSNAISLPATPNSLVPNRQGTKVYIGTNSGQLGSKGLMVLDTTATTVNQFTSAPGKVLTVSPDGTLVIVSDTTDTPNQVFIFNTTTNSNTAYLISGATAADFSPDSLKAYIVAGSTLYIYSKLDALQTIPLVAPANDVAFFAEGAFAYLAGGDPDGVEVRTTCSNGIADRVNTPAIPTFIRAVPDAAHMFAVSPPNVTVIDVSTMPTGCDPVVSDSPKPFNLGLGTFTASQMLLSPTGSTAYILSPNLQSVAVFNVFGETSSAIAISGNAVPLQAGLSPDGTQLVVGASDGRLHVVQTATNADTQQISFTQSFCQTPGGQSFGITCNPNLVAVKP
jgi:hypothetical protein